MIKKIKYKIRKTIILCASFFFTAHLFAEPVKYTQVLNASITAKQDKTRIVLDLNNNTRFQVFTLPNPNRAIVDLTTTLLSTSLKSLNLANSPIQDIRSSPRNGVDLRIVFDLKRPVRPEGFFIQSEQQHKLCLVINFYDAVTAEESNANTNVHNSQQQIAQQNPSQTSSSHDEIKTNNVIANDHSMQAKQQKTPVLPVVIPIPATFSNTSVNSNNAIESNKAESKHNKNQITPNSSKHGSSHRITIKSADDEISAALATPPPVLTASIPSEQHCRNIIVVIDPGHGGKDPGASGPNGVHEKDVVLEISKDLQERLNQIPGITAVLTRNGDYFIPLRTRLSIARQDKADLFVAIHADAYSNTASQGASVFALSERGASSEAARWLAERENYSELGGVQDFRDKSFLVRSVLLDLSQTVTITQSLQIGRVILDSLQELTPLHHNVVEQARFVVLKSPDIPSLLVETGFISNPLEEHRLNSSRYQDKLAESLAIGVEKYFWQNPPNGTLFAFKRETRTYIVARGDSLQGIAARYNVNVDELKDLNNLSSNHVHRGQEIHIPADNPEFDA